MRDKPDALVVPLSVNQVWSVDFMHDQLSDGRSIRLFNVIDEVSKTCNWQGWVGCEYKPKLGGQAGGTSAGLGWLAKAD